jgi:hypothetical protein
LASEETKVSKTKQEMEGQLLLRMFRRIAEGVSDIEIMKEFNIRQLANCELLWEAPISSVNQVVCFFVYTKWLKSLKI